jgi:hypothetical protein
MSLECPGASLAPAKLLAFVFALVSIFHYYDGNRLEETAD